MDCDRHKRQMRKGKYGFYCPECATEENARRSQKGR